MDTKEKKPIIPTLNMMNVGDEENFPMARYNSVTVAVSNMRLLDDGRVFTRTIDRKEKVIKVKRVA